MIYLFVILLAAGTPDAEFGGLKGAYRANSFTYQSLAACERDRTATVAFVRKTPGGKALVSTCLAGEDRVEYHSYVGPAVPAKPAPEPSPRPSQAGSNSPKDPVT